MARVEGDPDGYWSDVAKRLDWMTPFTQVKDVSFDAKDFRVCWKKSHGVLNVSVACIDRHLPQRADQTAIIWESDDGSISDEVTYGQLHAEVCRMANVLKARGVKKGDRVTLYLPMIPQAAYAMLACARIGAIHCSDLPGGFSPDQHRRAHIPGLRLEDRHHRRSRPARRQARAAEAQRRRGAEPSCPGVADVIVVRRTKADVPMTAGRDVFYSEIKATVSDQCDGKPTRAEDPLFDPLHLWARPASPRGSCIPRAAT